MRWETIVAPPGVMPPRPLTVRAQSIPPRHYFPEHAHAWHQVVYAISGVLTVAVEGRSFVISPEQAVWLPTGLRHRAGSLVGAEFRSLWIADEAGRGLPVDPTVFGVSPLLQALIIEAAEIEGQQDDEDLRGRVTGLILDQLRRAKPLPGALPWPRDGALVTLCQALYADPADPRGLEDWARELGMSGRTLARRFEAELGMSLRILATTPARVQGDRVAGRRAWRDAGCDGSRLQLRHRHSSSRSAPTWGVARRTTSAALEPGGRHPEGRTQRGCTRHTPPCRGGCAGHRLLPYTAAALTERSSTLKARRRSMLAMKTWDCSTLTP